MAFREHAFLYVLCWGALLMRVSQAWAPTLLALRGHLPAPVAHHGCMPVSETGETSQKVMNLLPGVDVVGSEDTITNVPASLLATLEDVGMMSSMDVSPWLIVAVALGLGVAAQSFINQMLEGDQGLGAFLKDGSGYNRSGFRQTSNQEKPVESDPLPWLRLPQLDFVEVAGQPSRVEEKILYERLETLRTELNTQLQAGQTGEALRIQEELESLMTEEGIEYTVD